MTSSNQFPLSRPSIHVGSVIDGYELTNLLGEGGMGAVYSARKGGLEYALKVMINPTELSAARFEREALSLAKVSRHPNIVTVHSYSKTGVSPYMVLEKIDGFSLRQQLESNETIEFNRVLEIGIKISDALAHIHKHDILHRDLKPDNILVRREDGEVFLTDFGIAKVVDGENSLTKTGDFIGTPYYMSPEQIDGDKDRLGPTADIWSLGVLLYQLATDTLPFDGSNSMELMTKILFQEPKMLTEVKPSLAPDFSRIVHSALQKDPENRYQSAAQFADDCRALKNGQKVMGSQRVLAIGVHGQKGSTRRTIFLIVLVLSLIIGGGFGTLNYNQRLWDQRFIQDKIVTLSKNRLLSVNQLELITASLIEEYILNGKSHSKLNLDQVRVIGQWVSLEKSLSDPRFQSVLADRKIKLQYKNMKDKLSHLHFLISLFEDSKMDLTGQRPPSSWRDFLKACEIMDRQSGVAYEKFKEVSLGRTFEADCALLALIYCDTKHERWVQAERSRELLSQRGTSLSLRMKAQALRFVIFPNLFMETVIKQSRSKKRAIREFSEIDKLAKKSGSSRAKLYRSIQRALDTYFKEAPTDKRDFNRRAFSYSLLEQLCDRFPLSRSIGHVDFHARMAKRMESSKRLGKAVFHYYQAFNADPNFELPREYNRYLLYRIKLSFKERRPEQKQEQYEDLLEMSHSGWHFSGFMLNSDLMNLQSKHGVLTRFVNEKPFSPYSRFWRLVANQLFVFRKNVNVCLKIYEEIKEDYEFLKKSKVLNPHFMGRASLNFIDTAFQIWQKLIRLNVKTPFSGEDLLKWLDEAKTFEFIEKHDLERAQRPILISIDLEDEAPKERGASSKLADFMLESIKSEILALDEHYQWSLKDKRKRINAPSRRLRLNQTDYNLRRNRCHLELSRLYQSKGDMVKVLSELALANKFTEGRPDLTLDIVNKYIEFGEYTLAQKTMNTVKERGGPQFRKRKRQIQSIIDAKKQN
jgi:serine/threonine protein kinase